MRYRALLAIAAIAALAAASPAASAAAPSYLIKATWGSSNLPPGGQGQFVVQARNVGDSTSEEPLTIVDRLPADVTATAIDWSGAPGDLSSLCSGLATRMVTCAVPASMGSLIPLLAPAPALTQGFFTAEPAGYLPPLFIDVRVGASPGAEGTNSATISGGGAPTEVRVDRVPFSKVPAPFGIAPGSFESDVFAGPFPTTPFPVRPVTTRSSFAPTST